MDIHHIHGPVRSLREFFVHLAIITLGILIALSLEGLLEWRHHRALVREARENLASEVTHNRKTIADNLPTIRKSEDDLKQIISVMQKLESNQALPVDQLSYHASFIGLNSTAWNTANRSGAVGYMSYDEVAKYTELYDLQQVFLDLQRPVLEGLTDLGGILPTVMAKDAKHRSPQSFEEIERIASRTVTAEDTLENAAKELSKQYEQFGK